jgi:general secretion pathway protein A
MSNKLLSLYGLKHNPFSIRVPVETLWKPASVEHFFHRVDSVINEGGFALISGENGLGKSKILRSLSHHLDRHGSDLLVGVIERPQNSIADLYRELGALFGVGLLHSNRYKGFKELRKRWQAHMTAACLKPVLLIDEAQEMSALCLNELRLLSSENFDSDCIISVVLCGDTRLLDRLSMPDLIPLGSRIGARLKLQALDKETLLDFLNHQLEQAGCPQLMTTVLKNTLAEHSGGNLRILCRMGDELLTTASERQITLLDEKLYFEMYNQPTSRKPRQK